MTVSEPKAKSIGWPECSKAVRVWGGGGGGALGLGVGWLAGLTLSRSWVVAKGGKGGGNTMGPVQSRELPCLHGWLVCSSCQGVAKSAREW